MAHASPAAPSSAASGPIPAREIPIRRPSFPFDPDSIPRHWANGNPLMTHIANAAQLTFPDGERFFIRAVKDVVPRIEDAELVRQARAFAGQEAIHGREHERYFDTMRAHGYAIDGFLAKLRRFIGWMDRLPASLRISMTAGLEHYTATFGWAALADPAVETFDPTMQALFVWHAAEEVEHKAVAFDVMQAAGIGHVTRIVGFLLGTLVFFGWIIAGSRMLLRQDGLSRRDVRRLARRTREAGDPRLAREVVRRVRDYFRRDFHPCDEDDFALARSRMAALRVPAEVGRALSIPSAA